MLLRIIGTSLLMAIGFALGRRAIYPLVYIYPARGCAWVLLNPVPKTSSPMNLALRGQPTRHKQRPKSTQSWPDTPASSGDRNVQCAARGFLGFSGTGLQGPKPLGGISFSFLELALVLKIGFGPAKLPLSRRLCKRLLESAAFPLNAAHLVPEISLT